MKRCLKGIFTVASTLLLTSPLFAVTQNVTQPKTFLGPYLQLGFANLFNDNAAYSVLGEAGARNYRIGGTIGTLIADSHKVKISAEYLLQDISYAFFTGNTQQWVNQGAFGLNYRYSLFDYYFDPELGFDGFVSRAPSKTLRSKSGSYISSGTTTFFTDNRNIAGSTGVGVAPGLTLKPWQGGTLEGRLNYDSVTYNTKYIPSEDALGLGGTFNVSQNFNDDAKVGFNIEWRQPYNNYSANITALNLPFHGNWAVGLNGNYLVGKGKLPDTYNIGLHLTYNLETNQTSNSAIQERDNILNWIATPAVYMPQVLAIPDDQVNKCIPPAFTGTIPDFIDDFSYSLGNNFSGTKLVYRINYNGQPNNGTVTVSGSTLTGHGEYPSLGYTAISVSATNSCGSVTSNAFNTHNTV